MLACACDYLLQYIFKWEYVDIGRESLLQHLITWMFAVIQVIGVPFSDKGDYKSQPKSKLKKQSVTVEDQKTPQVEEFKTHQPFSYNCLLTASFGSIKGRGGNSHTSRKLILHFLLHSIFFHITIQQGKME